MSDCVSTIIYSPPRVKVRSQNIWEKNIFHQPNSLRSFVFLFSKHCLCLQHEVRHTLCVWTVSAVSNLLTIQRTAKFWRDLQVVENIMIVLREQLDNFFTRKKDGITLASGFGDLVEYSKYINLRFYIFSHYFHKLSNILGYNWFF